MSLQELLKEVEERSSAERDRIRGEYEAEKRKIVQETEKKLKSLDDEYKRKMGDQILSLERKERNLIEMEARRIVESKRNELVSAISSKALEIVRHPFEIFQKEEYFDLMLGSSRKKLGDKITVRCSPENEKILRKRIDSVVADLPDEEPGIIALSQDGRRELNLTTTFMANDIREDILEEIWKRIRGM